jgi:hypothetical protein
MERWKRECSQKALTLLLAMARWCCLIYPWKLGCSRHHRKVFSLGGTVCGDDKNLSHMFVTRILRERLCCF